MSAVTASWSPLATRPILRGLLLREWLAHRGMLIPIAATWVIGLWILPLITSPAWLHWFGLWISLRLGTALGGAEAADGVEEFSFALPPTRGQRYLARLGLGLGIVLGLIVISAAAIIGNTPQHLWGLVVESGLTEPNTPAPLADWLTVLTAWPVVYAITFAIAANASTATGARGASWPAALIVFVLGLGGYWVEDHFQFAGRSLSLPLLALAGYVALHLGFHLYRRKEGISRPAAETSSRWWLWILLLAAAIAAVSLVALVTTREATHTSATEAHP
jgi:hypothetical protein